MSTADRLSIGTASQSEFEDAVIGGNGIHEKDKEILLDEILESDVFSLPATGSIQSLEEILREPDTTDLDENFFAQLNDELCRQKSNNCFDDSSEITSIATSSSFSKDATHSIDWKKPIRKKPKSQILRCVKLRGISAQILSADDKIKSGAPSALAVGCTHVAVGTTHGLTLIFDAKQVLSCCIGNSKNAFDYGSTSSVCFSSDDSRILIGYAKGAVCLHDAVNGGRLIQHCETIKSIGNGILNARFIADSQKMALINDAGGSVYALNFAKAPSQKACRCIFSGSRGDVCRAEPLNSAFGQSALVALTSMTKLIVVRLRPSISVLFARAHDDNFGSELASAPPLISWCATSSFDNGKHTNRPLDAHLAFARYRYVQIFQFRREETPSTLSHSNECFRTFLSRTIDVQQASAITNQHVENFTLVNIAWVNPRCLLTLDNRDRARIFDATTGECIETTNLDHVQLVYCTALFKGLATGSNVSKAMAYLADNVCYNSVASYSYGFGTGQVLILGHRAVYTLSLNSWLDCVDALASANDFTGAIALCLDYFTGKRKTSFYANNCNNSSSSAYSSMSTTRSAADQQLTNRRLSIIEEKTIALLQEYVDLSLTKFTPTHGKIEALQDYFRTVVPFCIETCVTLNREDVLYNCLYERFGVDTLAKGIFLECLDDYILDRKLKNIPPAIVQEFFAHLEREGFYSIIETCVVNLPIFSLDLHQVMTVCRNYNLYDAIIYVYNKGLNDYVTPMQEMIDILKDTIDQHDLLSDEDVKLGNKLLLYITCCFCGRSYFSGDFLIVDKNQVACDTYELLTTSITVNSVPKKDPAFPYLRTLLKFDCREFLNGLGMAFEAEFFSSRNGSVKMRYLVDILIKIMLKQDDWMPYQTGALFTFIARQIVMTSGEFLIDREQFQQILELVMCSGNVESVGTSVFEEKQQALLDLLQMRQCSALLDENLLLSLAEKHHYFQVCEIIYLRRRDYYKVVTCFAEDPYRKNEIFAYVRKVLTHPNVLLSEKLAVKSKFIQHIRVVAETDVKECSRLLNDFFLGSLLNICNQLEQNGRLVFEILLEIQIIRSSSGTYRVFCEDESDDLEILRLFIKLFCAFNPENLIDLLKSNPDSFCTRDVLSICRQYNVTTAILYLLMHEQNFEQGFDILKNEVNHAFEISDFKALETHLRIVIDFLNLNVDESKFLPEQKTYVEKLWFRLLDVILSYTGDNDIDTNCTTVSEKFILTEGFKDMVNMLVREMINVVDSSTLFRKLLEHSAFKNMPYCEIRSMIQNILKSYGYEEVLLSKLVNCMRNEIHSAFSLLKKLLSNGISGRKLACSVCAKGLRSGNSRYVIFSCSHSYHCSCLQTYDSCRQGRHGTKEWLCLFCTFPEKRRKANAMMKVLKDTRVVDSSNDDLSNIKDRATTISDKTNRSINLMADEDEYSKISLLDQLRHDKSQQLYTTGGIAGNSSDVWFSHAKDPLMTSSSSNQNFESLLTLAPPHT